jgi:protein-disulfide isomerase-like protein with CxxC motif
MLRMQLTALHFTDPGCPWAYSARPYHARLRWRFGDQLDWRLVLIGLAESHEQYVERGYTPQRAADTNRWFEDRFGMPFWHGLKDRVSATSPACRAIVAVRQERPELVETTFRALQFQHFTTAGRLDDPEALRATLDTIDGVDADAVIARLNDDAVLAAYEADRARARTAQGSPTHVQRRTATTDGPVRYTAPSVIFELEDGRSTEVGGFQPFESYDTALANLAPGLERRLDPSGPLEALEAFPEGLTTAELAEVLRADLAAPDVAGTRAALDALAADGAVAGEPVGGDALWRAVMVVA